MGIAITLKEYLANHGTEYELIKHGRTGSALETSASAHVPGDRMVKTILLGDEERYFLALIPATHHLDIDKLNQILQRKLRLVPEDELASAFSDCEVGSVPPVGEAYGIETLADSSLMDQPELFFESGDHGVLIRVDNTVFKDLVVGATPVHISEHL